MQNMRLLSISSVRLALAASVILAACSDGTAPITVSIIGDTIAVTGDFRETASASPNPDRAAIDIALTLMNQGIKPETLGAPIHGPCEGGVVVRAWRQVSGGYALAWISSALPIIPCPIAATGPLVIAPQFSATLRRSFGNAEILGDSLPAGNYTFTMSSDLETPPLPAQIVTPPLFVGLKYIVPPGTVLDGTWAGIADGIELSLGLHWTADSVTGAGTYLTFTPNTNRCGGGTLHGSGRVTLSASRVEDRVVGHMSFDNGWTPPYSAVQTGSGLLDGQFMSVDAGPCPMPLGRQLP